MQEEVEQRTVALVISTSKLTGSVLQSAMSRYLADRKENLSATKAEEQAKQQEKQERKEQAFQLKHTGKQTVKQLVGQNQGVTNIEVASSGIKDFERIARKYGVDYAVKKDRSGDTPKYLVFFKGRDSDAITAAFQEYSNKQVKSKGKQRTSVLEKLRKLVQESVDDPGRVRHKELER